KALLNVKSKRQLRQIEKLYETFISNLAVSEMALKTIAIPLQDGFSFVPINDIAWCKADGNYCTVHFADKTSVLTCRSLKDFEDTLSSDIFLRVHNSYIINLNRIKKYVRGEGGHVIMCDDAEVEI